MNNPLVVGASVRNRSVHRRPQQRNDVLLVVGTNYCRSGYNHIRTGLWKCSLVKTTSKISNYRWLTLAHASIVSGPTPPSTSTSRFG